MISAKQKFYLKLLVSLALVAGFSWGFFYVASFVRNARGSLGEIQQEILNHEGKRAAVKDAERIIAEETSDIERVKSLSVDKKEPLPFIEYLENLASRTGNKIAFEVPGGSEETLKFRITVEGAQAGVMQLFRLLEAIPYAVSVEEFDFYKLGGSARLIVIIKVLSSS